ncbi:putative bifunctional diguanylate cyclase/phosphodiesterase [Salinisphaera aquimarina]|uniref:Bifunctional diguanylate cyclase/phosphodiesterase n=1 Tax=Salinisphaera aquimarina TaxID=2094031 RepID=A0ABV7EPK0_9GAMM
MASSERLKGSTDKGFCVLDEARCLMFANAAFAKLLGTDDPHALAGRPFDDFLEEPGREMLRVAQHSDDPTPVLIRSSLHRSDGSWLPAFLTFHAFTTQAGDFAGAVLIVTRRSLGDSTAISLSERLEMALSAGALGAWSLDLRSGAAWRTALHDQVFGYDDTLPHWTYEKFLEHVIDEDRPAVKRKLAVAIETNSAWTFECRIRRPDGVIRWIWAQGRPEFDLQGEPVALFGVVKDISERKAAEEQIQFLAEYDPLTRLPNRRLLIDRLGQAVRGAQRSGQAGAVFFIDLDDFKTLNDTLGHHVGDQMLLEVARRLLSCLRAQDTVARFGGDEFVVIMEGLGSSQQDLVAGVQQLADKILAAIDQPYDFSVLQHRRMTCSIGAVTFDDSNDTPDSLLRQADLAMYRAKSAGGHAVQFYEPEMQIAIDARVALESEIQLGLKHGEFELYYQPQIDIAGETVAAEALIRWRHPRRGLVSPIEFIPTAEDSGLIMPLGRFVLQAACEQLGAWAGDPELAQISIAVNISARQFHHPDFVDDVFRVLDSSAIDPSRLVLELTESVLLDSIDDAVGKMAMLKARGVRFSLDDFGTGYSSLYYLKLLPLDQLKIDQRFVGDLLTDANDAAIVCTIIALAQCLGLGVIAEGVECEQASDFLLAHQCHLQQGHLFSEALEREHFETFLQCRRADVCSRYNGQASDSALY